MLAKEQRFIERCRARREGGAGAEPRQGAGEDRKIELPKKRQVVNFDFRAAAVGEQVAILEDLTKTYGRRIVHDGLNMTIRRGERWCVMGKRRRQVDAPKWWRRWRGRRHVRLGASLKMGYFAQQSLDLLDPT